MVADYGRYIWAGGFAGHGVCVRYGPISLAYGGENRQALANESRGK